MSMGWGTVEVLKNDVTWGQANSTGMPPDLKVNKVYELTYLSINMFLGIIG